MLDRGTVVLVPFPYTDLKTTKTRPALVLSSKDHNKAEGDVILCGITSNLRNSPASVLIDQADMAKGKLLKPSRIKAGKLLTVDSSIIRKELGQVKPDVLRRVWKELEASCAARRRVSPSPVPAGGARCAVSRSASWPGSSATRSTIRTGRPAL